MSARQWGGVGQILKLSILRIICCKVERWLKCHMNSIMKSNYVLGTNIVVSTVKSGTLFARFPTVEYISTISFLFLWGHSCCKKVPVEKQSKLSRGGAFTFLALFHKNHIHCQHHTMSRSCDPCTKSNGKSQFFLSSLSSQLMTSEESFIWSEHTQL